MAHSYGQIYMSSTNARFLMIRQQIFSKIFIVLWTLFPGIIKKIIKKQFFTPERYILPPETINRILPGKTFDLMINEDTIKCRQWGEGPAIVCVHGWSGCGLQFYGFVDNAISSGFSVIVFDGPGHGLSTGKTCNYFQMTDVVRALLCRPHAFCVAGLIGPSFGAAAIINSLSKENLTLPAVLIAPALQLKQMIDAAFGHYGIPGRVYMEVIAEFEKKSGYSFMDDNPVNLLNNENQIFLIVHDKDDPMIPCIESKKAADRFPSLKFMITKNLGHRRILKDEAVINNSLSFIRDHS